MIGAQQDFQDRVAEIEAYFAFIDRLDVGDVLLTHRDRLASAYTSSEQNDLVRTLKASAFLLLYNLMESTVVNAIEAIFDEFSTKNVSYDSCCQQVRRVVLGNLMQHNPTEILPNLSNLATDVVTKTFKKKKIVSGNVDARRIKDMADEYGFAHPAADGRHLLSVKSNRNDLAHGSKSFSEVGRDHTVAELVEIKNKVVTYLSAMMNNVAAYITNQQYLSASLAKPCT